MPKIDPGPSYPQWFDKNVKVQPKTHYWILDNFAVLNDYSYDRDHSSLWFSSHSKEGKDLISKVCQIILLIHLSFNPKFLSPFTQPFKWRVLMALLLFHQNKQEWNSIAKQLLTGITNSAQRVLRESHATSNLSIINIEYLPLNSSHLIRIQHL